MLSLMHSATALFNVGAACNAVQHHECQCKCHFHCALNATDADTVLSNAGMWFLHGKTHAYTSFPGAESSTRRQTSCSVAVFVYASRSEQDLRCVQHALLPAASYNKKLTLQA